MHPRVLQMARYTLKSTVFLFFIAYVVNSVTGQEHEHEHEHEEEQYEYIKTLNPRILGFRRERLTHFRVYWQDIIQEPNPSGVTVIKALGENIFGFGFTRMIDNPLTLELALGSRVVGRAQGLYAVASQGEIAMLMVQNFVFTEGRYNGSTISILGRNPVMSPRAREMPIIGGSGVFRFARGYVLATTSMLNVSTGDAVVEYNCFVIHY